METGKSFIVLAKIASTADVILDVSVASLYLLTRFLIDEFCVRRMQLKLIQAMDDE